MPSHNRPVMQPRTVSEHTRRRDSGAWKVASAPQARLPLRAFLQAVFLFMLLDLLLLFHQDWVAAPLR